MALTPEVVEPMMLQDKPAHRSRADKCCICLRKFLLPILICCGVTIGVILGFVLRTVQPGLSKVQLALLGFPGDLLIQMMKLLLLPITISSVITAVGKMNMKSSGKVGIRAIVYYLSTLCLAAALGIGLGFVGKPGEAFTYESSNLPADAGNADPGLAFMDMIRNMFPDNIIEACFTQKRSKIMWIPVEGDPIQSSANGSESDLGVDVTRNASVDSTMPGMEADLVVSSFHSLNMVGLLMFSMALGAVLSTLGEKGKPLLELCDCLFEASLKLILIVVWFVPFAVIFMTATNIISMSSPGSMIASFGLFHGLMVIGLLIHGLIVLPVIYFVIVRRNPYTFERNMAPALLMAFATESSAATIPVTMRCLLDTNHIDARIVKLIVPVGATVNMDGSCMYGTILPIFIAQLHGIPLNIGFVMTMFVLAVAMAIGSAGVPGSGGGAFEILYLSALNLPGDDIAFIIVINWLMTRFRTAVNVLGDAIGCGIVEKLSWRELHAHDFEDSIEIETAINNTACMNGHLHNNHVSV